jgi:hypothetical protein
MLELGIESEVSDFCLASVGWVSAERAINHIYEQDD